MLGNNFVICFEWFIISFICKLFHIHFFMFILFMIIENSLCVNINIEVRIQEDELGKDKDGVEVRTDGKARCILEFNRFIL